MRKLTAIGATLIAWLYATPVSAEKGALALLRECEGREPQGMPEMGLLACATSFSGMLDMHGVMVYVGVRPLFCLPQQGIQNEQAMRIFIRWGQLRPQDLHQTARMGALQSLVQAFPCR